MIATIIAATLFAEIYPISCENYMTIQNARQPAALVKDWVDLGITHPASPYYDPVGMFGEKSDPALFRELLDECARAGLRVIVADMRVRCPEALKLDSPAVEADYRLRVEAAKRDWASHPAVEGFHLWDEPHGEHTESICRAARIVREVMPDKYCDLNLLPWYDWIGKMLKVEAHAPYLDAMFEKSALPILKYDLYDHMSVTSGETKGSDIYFENLRNSMEAVKRHPGTSFRVTQLCYSFAGREVKTEADYAWQLNTAAAMGAKGVDWYYPDISGVRPGELIKAGENYPINVLGERTDNFRYMSFANRTFQKFYGSEFMRLAIESAWMEGASHGGLGRFPGDGRVLGFKATGKALTSFFHDVEGRRYLAIVNLERRKIARISVCLGKDVRLEELAYYGDYVPRNAAPIADPVLRQQLGDAAAGEIVSGYAPAQLRLFRLLRLPQP